MQNKKLFKIHLITFLFLFILINHLLSQINPLFEILQEYATLMGEHLYIEKLSLKEFSSNVTFINLRDEIRKSGLFVDIYKLDKPWFVKLCELNIPFIAFLKNNTYFLVKRVQQKNNSNLLQIMIEGEQKELTPLELFEKIKGVMLFPCGNVMFNKSFLYGDSKENLGKGKIFIIYIFHEGTDFKEIEPILNNILEETHKEGRKLIYLEELGLIPFESVEAQRNSLNLSDQTAFDKVKETLRQETAAIEEGIPVYDESIFYSALYKYLAKNKIKSILEDLKYDNWKSIVTFDSYGLVNEALSKFLMGGIDNAIVTMKSYLKGFMLNNHKIRDINFSNQIKELLQKNPNSVILTIRGLAHYGFEDNLASTGVDVNIYIVGEGPINKLIPAQHYTMVLKQNDVYLPEDKYNELTAKSLVEFVLLDYYMIDLGYTNYPTAVRMVNTLLEKISFEDIKLLCDELFMRLFRREIDSTTYKKFVFDWLRNRQVENIKPTEK
ncbi:MAG: hypothetical protein NC818_07560, partial [Candidatus Omnitrophica bacterium]|nr:hypothetical protein [Candidatus Omnitrophota bacterium]